MVASLFKTIAEALGLGVLAVGLWLLASPIDDVADPARAEQLLRSRARPISGNTALAQLWWLQLPGTATACLILSGIVALARLRRPQASRAQAAGEAFGGSIGLLLFANPIPGICFAVWALTFVLTGAPVLMLSYLLDSTERMDPVRGFLIRVWPVLVTWLLVSATILLSRAIVTGAQRIDRARRSTVSSMS